MNKRLTLMILTLTLTAILSSAQEAGPEVEPLPRGFGSVTLGVSLEEARELLQGDRNFNYRGAPDVSLRPFDQETSIESEGRGFMDRGAFLFAEDALYIITLFLDQERLDYFTLYRTLTSNYGDPDSLSPQRAIWENENTRIVLERPLTVKYIDLETFQARIDEGAMEESLRALSRNNFLEQF